MGHYTSVSSPAATVGQYAAGAGSRLSYAYPTTFTGTARNFGTAKSISSFPSFGSYSRNYQWPAAQKTFSKPSTSYVTTPSYSTTSAPNYSTVYSTPKSSTFTSGVYSTAATPVSSYPASYSTPTVSTFSSSFPAFVTPTAATSSPAYSASVSSTSAPFAKAYSTPATVTTTFPAANAYKSTLGTDYNAYSSASPQLFRDSSRPVVTQFSSPGLWTSQGSSRSFFSNVNSPVTIQKSTTFTPAKPTLSAYADAVTLHPLSGQYNTAVKNLGSQYSTQQSQYYPETNVVGSTVYTKPAYNSYSSVSSVPVAYSTPASWASYPTAQSVRLPAAAFYSVPAASHGAHWSGTSHLSSSAYNAQPTYTYTLQGAPLAREYHTLEAPHTQSWNTANSWSSLPAGKQLYVS